MTTVATVDSSGNTIYTQKPTLKVTTRNYIGDFIKTGNSTWEVPTEDGHIFIDTRNKIKTHYYYVRDYLGSTRAVVDTAGMLLQTMNYYPSGVPFSRMEQEAITDRLHTGKPFLDMNGLGYYDNNARFLDILTGGFISRDALAGSYPHLSPYANCANNPLIYIDPTGMFVIASSIESQRIILNTLSPQDQKFVEFSNSGIINAEKLNSHISSSVNYNNLIELNNSVEKIFVLTSSTKVEYVDNNGNSKSVNMPYWGVEEDFKDISFKDASGVTTGETGRLGMTLLPGIGPSGVNSPDKNIYVILNGQLSDIGAAETYSHEANGHALMYIRTNNRIASGHQINGSKEMNKELFEMIIDSRKETIKNMNK